MATYNVQETSLTAVADAIRTKGGTSAALSFPNGFVNAIDAIETGGGDIIDDFILKNGITSVSTSLSTGALREYLFRGSTSLQTFQAENYTGAIPSFAFYGCSALTSVKLPKATSSGSNAFQNCTALTSLALPGINSSISTDIFRGCKSLVAFDINAPSQFGANTFNGNSAMNVLIIRKSTSIVALGNVNAFSGTPFESGGSGGTIYIPKSLYDQLGTGTNDYKAATNWSTIDSYGTITWMQIEGSQYETQYADGTPISS